MPILHSAPLGSNLRRIGGASAADTDLMDFQTTNTDGVNTGYSAVTYSNGFPERLEFDGNSALFTCVPNATGLESQGSRSEIRFPKLVVPDTGYLAVTIAFDFMVESLPHVSDGDPGYSIAQMHCGIQNTWLTWMLYETNGELSVSIPAVWASGNDTSKPIGGIRYRAGAWNRLHAVHWVAKNQAGAMRFFLNNARFAGSEGQSVHEDNSTGPYFKLGIYNILRRTVGPLSVRFRDVRVWSGPVPDNESQFRRELIRTAEI